MKRTLPMGASAASAVTPAICPSLGEGKSTAGLAQVARDYQIVSRPGKVAESPLGCLNDEENPVNTAVPKGSATSSLQLGRLLKSVKGGRGGRRAMSGLAPGLPPPLNVTPTLHHRFRFRAASSLLGVGISATSIVGALGTIGTVTNTDVASMASSFRIRAVTVWPPQASGSDLAFLEWTAGSSTFTKDEVKVMDLPDGITVTGSVVFRPPPKSLYSDWIAAGNAGYIFDITCNSGTIVDLDVDFTLSAAYANLIIPVATAALNTVYYLALDGPSSNKLVPIGLPTTH